MQRGCLGAGIREGTKGTLYALGEQDGLWFRPGSGFMGTREWRCSLQDEPGDTSSLFSCPAPPLGHPGLEVPCSASSLKSPERHLGLPCRLQWFLHHVPKCFFSIVLFPAPSAVCLGRESKIQPLSLLLRLRARRVFTKELKGEEVLSKR